MQVSAPKHKAILTLAHNPLANTSHQHIHIPLPMHAHARFEHASSQQFVPTHHSRDSRARDTHTHTPISIPMHYIRGLYIHTILYTWVYNLCTVPLRLNICTLSSLGNASSGSTGFEAHTHTHTNTFPRARARVRHEMKSSRASARVRVALLHAACGASKTRASKSFIRQKVVAPRSCVLLHPTGPLPVSLSPHLNRTVCAPPFLLLRSGEWLAVYSTQRLLLFRFSSPLLGDV